jgi:bacterioferritin-associated ferredoxin
MYVCVCKAITDEMLKKQAKDRNWCPKEVCRSLGIGSECGVCYQKAMKVLESNLKAQARTPENKKA